MKALGEKHFPVPKAVAHNRFNMSLQNCTADIDGTAVFTNDSGRPCFTSIARNTAFLNKKLSANGYSRRNQEDIAKEGDYETDDDREAELVKCLNKVRQHAVTAVRGGQKTFVSRNTYKDKGGKSSQNSKVQK